MARKNNEKQQQPSHYNKNQNHQHKPITKNNKNMSTSKESNPANKSQAFNASSINNASVLIQKPPVSEAALNNLAKFSNINKLMNTVGKKTQN